MADQSCVDFIKSFEGCKLTAYKDPGSKDGLPVTIGYGSIMYEDGSKIKLGDVITMQRAEQLLNWEISKKATVLSAMNLKLNANQFNAVLSFIYNCGIGAFNSSTLLKKIRINPNDTTIKSEFLKWVNNDGKVMSGLVKRRTAESALYFSN